jgi:hypothetical protein
MAGRRGSMCLCWPCRQCGLSDAHFHSGSLEVWLWRQWHLCDQPPVKSLGTKSLLRSPVGTFHTCCYSSLLGEWRRTPGGSMTPGGLGHLDPDLLVFFPLIMFACVCVFMVLDQTQGLLHARKVLCIPQPCTFLINCSLHLFEISLLFNNCQWIFCHALTIENITCNGLSRHLECSCNVGCLSESPRY